MTNKKHSLYQAILALNNEEECEAFFRDLCTPKEIKDFQERWLVAQYLEEQKLSYRDISKTIKASLSTISRVARFLVHEPYQGYKMMIQRLNKG